MNNKVELNWHEEQLGIAIGTTRYRENRKRGIEQGGNGPPTTEETDIHGAHGEIAFCKLFNVYPATDTLSWSYYDCVLYGYKIDVKATKGKNNRLIAPISKAEKRLPDYYALMIGEYPHFEFKGFIKSEDLINESHIKDLGYGDTYVAERHELFMELPKYDKIEQIR